MAKFSESGDGGPVEGVKIVGVTPGSAADEAGLRTGDIITAINDESMSAETSTEANRRVLDFMAGVEEGDILEVEYLRDGKVGTVEVEPRPVEMSASEAKQFVEGLPARSNNASMFYPWIEVPDPVGVGRNPRRYVPPSGHMAGVFARTDNSRGVWKAPAGIEATVSGHDEEYRLTRLGFAGGEFTVARQPIATGSPVRLRLAARDVSLTLQRQTGTSILNILPVTVDAISLDDDAQVTVRVLAESVPILARITRKSATELGLQPGMQVFAQAKSIALLHSSGPGAD